MAVRDRALAGLNRLGAGAGAVLLAPAAAAAAPLWLVSATTRRMGRSPLLQPAPSPEPLVHYVPRLGIRTRPNLRTFGRAQDVFQVTTDADGRRGLLDIDEAAVLACGDSFAFGYGVDDADCFTEHCGDVLVKSVASPAHSMVHTVLELQDLGTRLHGKTVVWLTYCGNDLSDNLHPNLGATRVPFVRRGPDASWELVTDHVTQEEWTFAAPPRDNGRLFVEMSTPSPYQERVFSAADHLIGAAHDVCREAGARLVVMSVPPTSLIKDPEGMRRLSPTPSAVDLTSPDRHLAASCHRRQTPFLSLTDRLRPRHYWPQDMHWNPSGHRLVGAAIREVLREAAGRPRRGE